MNRKPEDQLAAWTEAALQQLPPKSAPARLSQRVLERIQREAARPWYRKPWLSWPFSIRLLSAAGLGGIIYAAINFVQPAGDTAADQLGEVVAYGSAFESLAKAIIQGLATNHPWLVGMLTISLAAAAIVTFGCGAVFLRFAQNER